MLRKRLNLVQKFSILSLLCIALIGFAMGFITSHHLTKDLLNREAVVTAQMVQAQVKEHDLYHLFTPSGLRKDPGGIQELLAPFKNVPDVVRVKLWDREATVLWADDARLVGRLFPENKDVRAALQGQVVAEIHKTTKPEQIFEHEKYPRLIEVYVPIVAEGTQEVLGVVEVYKDPAPLFAEVRQAKATAWIVSILGSIFLYLSLFWIVRRSYQAQLRLERELEGRQRQRLEDILRFKSEFIANMSHELRTPLNSIIGFSELLIDRLPGELNEKQAKYVNNVLVSGRHLLSLINDILDLSRVEAGKIEIHLEEFPLAEAVEAALITVRPQAAKKQISLGREIAPGVSTITADPLRFKQMMYNLLSNAIKFTPPGGHVSVSARVQRPMSEVQSPERTDVGPRTSDAATFVEISVQDTGIGIQLEDQGKLFREFSQVGGDHPGQQEGTGLGLALTKRLVELHGGMIWVESEGEGKGSTFTFILPCAHGRDSLQAAE